MIQWKQRLYAFLLRRVLGPLLDASATKKLHDSIEFSLQEGRFILKDISLNAEHLSERLAITGSMLSIRKATVQRLEICFTLRENGPLQESSTVPTAQSSFAWRAMKLGGGTTPESSLPAVSLVAEIHVNGVELELAPVDSSQRSHTTIPSTSPPPDEEIFATKSMIGSYVDAALASLSLTLKLSNIHVKMCHTKEGKETWVAVRLSSMTYKDLDQMIISSAYRMVLNKSVELSDITIHAGEEGDVSRSTVVAMAQGTGRVFFRMIEYPSNTIHGKTRNLSQDIEVNLNHQVNISLDQSTLQFLFCVADSWVQKDEAGEPDTTATKQMMAAQNSLSHLKNPWIKNEDEDPEDLKTITGIMKQYREAYHLAENNQLRGGILVPSHAFFDDVDALEEDETMTFDIFFDANDQSFYNSASVIKESVLMRDDANDDSDNIQTKLRLHLLSTCFKINFCDLAQRSQPCVLSQEYVLLTMEDLNVSWSSTRLRSELTVSVAHFEIEDAQLDPASRINNAPGTIDIGSIFSYVSEPSDSDGYENEAVVSQTPCMTFHVQTSKESEDLKSIVCNLALSPIEAVIRQRSLANLTQFASDFAENKRNASTQPRSAPDQVSEKFQISFSCQLPSLTVEIPLTKSIPVAPLFNRCGETLRNAAAREASLGLTLWTIDFQWTTGDQINSERNLESSAAFNFCHMLIFATAPVGDKVSPGAKMQRIDFMLLNGRTEVDPYIPISFQYKKKLPLSSDGSLGREFFPVVPTLSSFKARQEDEDDELKIDRLLFSKLRNVEADSRKDLRGTDPQIAMVTDAEKSDIVISISIPEMFLDLTKAELTTIITMLESANPAEAFGSSHAKGENADTISLSKPTCLGIAFNIEQMTFSLKQNFCIQDLYGDKTRKDRFSCLLAVNNLRVHVLLNGSNLRHFRLMMHDLGFYSALHPRIDAEVCRTERDVRERVILMKQRLRIYKESLVSPILFRSKIFSPICQDAPSFLVDIRDTASIRSIGETKGFSQKQLHVTLYHLTLRHNIDSDWIEKLQEILPQTKLTDPEHHPSIKNESPPSMTRVFVSIADCNLDYSSPTFFETESRSIVRLGDLRFSSNIMIPANRNQAYSISLGDLSYHISNQRISHSEEDSKLCCAPIIMPTNPGRSRRCQSVSMHGTTAEAVLREMGFVDILGLDSVDAVIAVTDWSCPGQKREPGKDPRITTSLTFGLLSVNACKDSFNCFAATVGELQAKLTALTDEDLSRVRGATVRRNQERTTSPAVPTVQPSMQRVSGLDSEQKGNSDAFLLDGYDWTEIDHDPLREWEIPDGDEQVAGWYNSLLEGGTCSTGLDPRVTVPDQMRGYPGRIIHHHFPFHSISNPMSEGDMGAAGHAGKGSELVLKSRVLIHKLAVKLRFYDGYDWPEKLNDREKKLLRRNGTFVIEPLPRDEAVKAKEALASEVASKFEDEDLTHMKRKVAIMADLLSSVQDVEEKSPFDETPLPEDRAKVIEQKAEMRRLSRKTKIYLQVSVNGVTVRIDAYEESITHRLASVIGVSVSDLFVAETASLSYPVKMLGEWVNESEHPRDTRFGTLMLKVITWKPINPLTDQNEVESDDCEIAVQLLPMRAIIDQRAIHFIQAFLRNDDRNEKKETWSSHLHLIPPPRFRSFRVKAWKLKVDYIPQKLDISALRDGSIVELINLSPIDGMVITLSQVSVEDVVGLGDVMGGLTSNWLQEIVSTQLHKFLANARLFEPISDVGQGLSDLVVLPYEAFRNGEDVRRAMTTGIKSLAETVTFQALTTSSRLTEYAANKMSAVVGGRYHNSAANALPARPTAAPKGIRDVTGHAMESLARGLHAANYKVVIVPYREYNRNGAAGAATSVLRGIPVMVVAPMTGATEALSYTLLGARNALRPDIRREEEASRTGFASYDI